MLHQALKFFSLLHIKQQELESRTQLKGTLNMEYKMDKASFADYTRLPGRYNTLAPFYMMSGNQESLGGSGDISVKCYNSKLFSTSESVLVNLPKGLQDGQLKKLQLVHKGSEDANVTVFCPSLVGDYDTIVFTNVGDSALLGWTGGAWCVLETVNSTDVTLGTPEVVAR